jgi:hypothetical protein
MHQGEGWTALGHKSFNAWADNKFKASRQHYWRLLRDVELNIKVNGSFPETTGFIYRGKYDNGNDYIPECWGRLVVVLPETQWRACWAEIERVAATKEYPEKAQPYHAGKIRKPIIEDVVACFKRMSPVGITEEADEFACANRQKAARFTGNTRPKVDGELSVTYEESTGKVRLFDQDDNPSGYLHPDDLYSVVLIFAQTAPPHERAALLRYLQDTGGK